jgi:hypothetical protein
MKHLADLRHIPFTLYEVLNILGLKNNGNNHRQVGNSILRINKTLIGSFCREDKKAYTSAHFTPWQDEFGTNENLYRRATASRGARISSRLRTT